MSKVKIELPPKLVDVFSGSARYRGAFGGRGSGKTQNFAKMTAIRGYQEAMAGRTGQILCGREFQNSLEESSFIEVKNAIMAEPWLNDFYDIGQNYIRTKCGRIKYVFAGLRHNLDSIKSKGKLLLVWVDEAENVSNMAWAKLIPTVREESSEVWITWNPESDESATHLRFRADPPENSKIVELNWKDNPWWNSVLEQERLDDQRKRPETYNWIWEGGFNENKEGHIFAKYLLEHKDKQTLVPYKDGVPVFTAWDLGKGDMTAIWFCQIVGFQPRIIDYYEASNEDLPHYAKVIRSKPYDYLNHFMPHDSRHERMGMDGSIKDQWQGLGFDCYSLPNNQTIKAGIDEARELIKIAYFDKDKCHDGLRALKAYRYEYDENRKTFGKNPVHDWASHPSDAFRYLARACKIVMEDREEAKPSADPFKFVSGGWSG